MVSPSSSSATASTAVQNQRFVNSFPTSTSRPINLFLDHARRRALSNSSILSFHSGRPRDALLVRWKPTARLYTATTVETTSTKPKRENRRRNRRLSKRRNEEKQTKRQSSDWRHVTHGDHGRLIMTKERFENEPSIQALNLDPQSVDGFSPKNIVHNAKQAMKFKLRVEHVVRGPGGDQMFFATTTCTMDKSQLSHVPDSTTVVKDVEFGKDVVKFMTTGVARAKRHAEMLASVDLIVFLKECGVDLSQPPPKPNNDGSDATHMDHGRQTMTQHRMDNDSSIKAFEVGQFPKQTIHNAKQAMLFQLRYEHVVQGRKNDKMYLATTIATIDRSLLPNVPDSVTFVRDDNSGTSMVELMTTGAARSKGQAEKLACVDLIAYLHECGVDARKPPNVQALRHMEEQERFKVELRNAQMLLELCHASNPHYVTSTSKHKTIAKVTIYLDGQQLTAEASGPSIAVAQSKALVEASKSLESLEAVTGRTRIQEFKKFIQDSPGGHVAALHVNPLADEIFEELEDSIGTPSDHSSRMERFAEMKSEFEASFHPRPQRSFRNKLIQNHSSTTNAAFKEEEHARLKKATENQEGKQGKMKAIRDALPITAIRQTLIDALQTNQVLVVSGGTGSG